MSEFPRTKTWVRQGKDSSPDVMLTCTHRADDCIIVKEAEQVTILYARRTDRTHFSVQYKGWFTCSTMTPEQFDNMDMSEILQRAQEKVQTLRVIADT